MNENLSIESLYAKAVDLLKQLIGIPSLSKMEDKTADALELFFAAENVSTKRYLNNLWVTNQYFEEGKFTILLNSHHDTVKPNAGYILEPHNPKEENGKLFGLGSNDAGGSLVCLAAVFLYYYSQKDLPFNLVFAASAEEEISGINGIESLLPLMPKIDCAIVGEPTSMQMAIAEKGLLVLDCRSLGKAGHAARNEGENSIYKAMKDIQWFKDFNFPRHSELLGDVKMSVTSLEAANKQHNVVPDECNFVVDVRVNELYNFDEILSEISRNITSECAPRSLRLKPGFISPEHPLVKAGKKIGLISFGSPTLSDRALMNFPALKLGPGDSERSHTADEFIYLKQIEKGIKTYIQLLQNIEL